MWSQEAFAYPEVLDSSVDQSPNAGVKKNSPKGCKPEEKYTRNDNDEDHDKEGTKPPNNCKANTQKSQTTDRPLFWPAAAGSAQNATTSTKRTAVWVESIQENVFAMSAEVDSS